MHDTPAPANINAKRVREIAARILEKWQTSKERQERIKRLKETIPVCKSPSIDDERFIETLERLAGNPDIVESFRALLNDGKVPVEIVTRVECPGGIEEHAGGGGKLWVVGDINLDDLRRYLGLPPSAPRPRGLSGHLIIIS